MAINATLTTHTCGSFTNFLDLECILVNNLSGTPMIFIGVAVFAFLMISAWLRMSVLAVGLGFLLLGVILSPISQGFFVITVILAFIAGGFQIAKAFTR